MELFVSEFLDNSYDVVGGLEEGSMAQQQLYFLAKKDGLVSGLEVHQGIYIYILCIYHISIHMYVTQRIYCNTLTTGAVFSLSSPQSSLSSYHSRGALTYKATVHWKSTVTPDGRCPYVGIW